MFQKKLALKSTALAVLACGCMAFSGGAAAQGVPTIDAAAALLSTTQQIETMTQWAKQWAQINEQIQGAKKHYDAIRGSYGLSLIFNETDLQSLKEWADLSVEIKSTAFYATERAKFGTFPTKPKLNRYFDGIASHKAQINDLFAKSRKRSLQVQQLLAAIETATEPSQKADLTNRLISETNSIAANQHAVQMLEKQYELEVKEAARETAKETVCREFNKPTC